MIWIFLAIMGTFLWSWTNILDKILRTKYLKSSVALMASFGSIGLILNFILFLFVGIPNIPFWNLLAAFIGGVILTCALVLYLKALSIEEASRVVPLWHLRSIFVLIFAIIFLNEILTQLRYYAFISILLGGFLISVKRRGKGFHFSPAVAFILLSSFLIAIVNILMKFAFGSGIFGQTFLVFYIGVSLSSLSLFIFKKVRKDFAKALVSHKYILVFLIIISAIFGFSGNILFNKAISLSPVTLVTVFVSFQSLFVLLIATFLSIKFPLFIKEAINVKTIGVKLVAIALMALGLYLLTL